MKDVWKKVKAFWNYVWNGDDLLSWILSIVFAFIIIQFIFYPGIGLLLGTSHPIVAVVSGSMEHKVTSTPDGLYGACGTTFTAPEGLNREEFWETCGEWYENREITYEEFQTFHFSKGMNTGDVVMLYNPGVDNLNVGDIIVFIQEKNPAREPIIHRIIAISKNNGERVFQTKGDHNADSINISTQSKYLNEFEVKESEIQGKALISIPYVGYVKIWAFNAVLFIRGLLL